MHLRTVLCPVDLTPLSNRAVDLGVPEGRREALQFHVEAGAPADHILRLTVELGAKLVLMGCHSKGALERLFTRATAREVLHRSPCPVWFVTGSFGEEGPRTASASRAPST